MDSNSRGNFLPPRAHQSLINSPPPPEQLLYLASSQHLLAIAIYIFPSYFWKSTDPEIGTIGDNMSYWYCNAQNQAYASCSIHKKDAHNSIYSTNKFLYIRWFWDLKKKNQVAVVETTQRSQQWKYMKICAHWPSL